MSVTNKLYKISSKKINKLYKNLAAQWLEKCNTIIMKAGSPFSEPPNPKENKNKTKRRNYYYLCGIIDEKLWRKPEYFVIYM